MSCSDGRPRGFSERHRPASNGRWRDKLRKPNEQHVFRRLGVPGPLRREEAGGLAGREDSCGRHAKRSAGSGLIDKSYNANKPYVDASLDQIRNGSCV